MCRFGHGHSLGLGFLLALALTGHLLTYTLIVLAAGVLLGRAWATWALWASALRDKWHLARRERIPTRPTPVYRAPCKPKDEIPF